MRPVPSRLIAVALAAGSLIMVPFAAGAGAATPTTCSKATFTPTTATASTAKSTLSGCTNAALTGGSGTLVANFKNLAKITGKITWKGTGTSSFTLKEGAGPKVNKCKGTGATKDSLVVSTGTISSGTGKAVALNKTKFSESLCVHSTGSGKTAKTTEYLLPGSKIAI